MSKWLLIRRRKFLDNFFFLPPMARAQRRRELSLRDSWNNNTPQQCSHDRSEAGGLWRSLCAASASYLSVSFIA
jgi:hypothetical protein